MSRQGRHASPGRVVRPRWIYPTTILLGGAMIGTISVLSQSHTLLTPATATVVRMDLTAPSACANPAPVDVVASPRIYDVVRAAATKAGTTTCTHITVTSAESATTANDLAAGHGPDLWVPDSSTWATDVNGRVTGEVRQGPSLATSPLVIAVPSAQAVTSATWTQLVDGDVPMRIADPVSNSSGRLALIAARASLGGDQAMAGTYGAGLVALSRSAATSDSALLDALITDPTAASAFPVSEVALRAYVKAHPSVQVKVIVPTDGTARLDFPLLTRSDASVAATRAATALTTEMLSPQLRGRIQAAGLRTSITDSLAKDASGNPLPAPTYASLPTAEQTATMMGEWVSAQTDARMLVAMDTSGSMAQPAGTTTRIALAKEAADTALANMPDTSTMGLWTFSSKQNGTADYREVVPMRQLDALVGETSQRDALAAGFTDAAVAPKGDTGLYDTIAAGYAELQRTYDPTVVNTLVVITDGTNDDTTGGLTLHQLLSRLTAADPSKPISIALVGISKDADGKALRTIATATGGRVYLADDPTSITDVLVDALLSHQS